jgi:UDP-N-acetylglucosamine--N-acetylmuramyl-(pentapeptide) pyrophosphoryl-undecaprenol N-acetylglucosamine transferase
LNKFNLIVLHQNILKMEHKRSIFLAAGGTGGHIFPAIALGEQLAKRGYQPVLLTDARTRKYIGKNDLISFEFIPVKYPYGSLMNKVRGAISLALSYFASKRLIKKYKPLCVVGFGGYPSFPTLYAAINKNIKTVIHEQNSLLGKANQMLAEKVDAIATSFPDVLRIEEKELPKVVYTGNPVRPAIQAIRNLPYPEFAEDSAMHILITGGSQGANVFSKIVPEAIEQLPQEYRGRIRIDQQVRLEDIDNVRAKYKEMGVNAELSPFFADLPTRMASCHLVICRSGASSLAETAVAGRPAIMVPLPNAKDNHQMINANSYEDVGAGWVMPEESFTPEALTFRLENFFKLPASLLEAAEKAKQASIFDADSKLADVVEKLVAGK